MHESGGPGWRITMDTSGPMLIALYLRDVAGLDGAGKPLLSHAAPKVRHADHSHLTSDVGGIHALKTEWEAWWEKLVKTYPNPALELAPPSFKAFGNSPALQRVLQAHFGSALGWATDRIDEYAKIEAEREANGVTGVLNEMVEDHDHEPQAAVRARCLPQLCPACGGDPCLSRGLHKLYTNSGSRCRDGDGH